VFRRRIQVSAPPLAVEAASLIEKETMPFWQPAGTANRRISNFEGWKRFAKSFLKQTKYIHSTFDVRRSSVSFSIRPAVFWAGGGADS